MGDQFLPASIREFRKYQSLGEKTMEQLPDEALFWQVNEASNAISTIVKHLSGNMISRWTDIFHADGEKPWRNRDEEFVHDISSREALMIIWKSGWDKLYETLGALTESDLDRIIYIRNEAHTVTEAIVRQISHYSSHIGQIQFIGKMYLNDQWRSLSIPKNASDAFNKEKFSNRY
jgi:hypothetical protein